MSRIAERLRAHWLAQGIEVPPGVGDKELDWFEAVEGVALPEDLRDYFRHADGMGPSPTTPSSLSGRSPRWRG